MSSCGQFQLNIVRTLLLQSTQRLFFRRVKASVRGNSEASFLRKRRTSVLAGANESLRMSASVRSASASPKLLRMAKKVWSRAQESELLFNKRKLQMRRMLAFQKGLLPARAALKRKMKAQLAIHTTSALKTRRAWLKDVARRGLAASAQIAKLQHGSGTRCHQLCAEEMQRLPAAASVSVESNKVPVVVGLGLPHVLRSCQNTFPEHGSMA